MNRELDVDGAGVARCRWCASDPQYRDYHDTEWGFPKDDDRALFEKLCLEGFQAGLSWLTILRKRASFREAFRAFDIDAVARLGPRDVGRLLLNDRIVRHRAKIESTINNARRAREVRDEFGSLAAFLWRFAPDGGRPKPPERLDAVPARTAESTELSKALRGRGWTFVGPTTAYAFMQAVGMVNDHLAGCHVRERVEALRRRFVRPV